MPNTPLLLFDHIPRTGGTYFAEVLSRLIGSTSQNLDCGPDYPETHAKEMRRLDRYHVIVGHMRLDTVKAFRQIRPRNLITIVRDPVALIESTYTFWRFNIKESLPHCNMAKNLPFSEFIRRRELRMVVDNPITRHFFGLWDLERLEQSETAKAMAVQMAESYAFMGVTERMEDSIRGVALQFAPKKANMRFGEVTRNESKGGIEVTEEDREYLRAQTLLDQAIYRHANEKLDELLLLYGSTAKGSSSGLRDLMSLR